MLSTACPVVLTISVIEVCVGGVLLVFSVMFMCVRVGRSGVVVLVSRSHPLFYLARDARFLHTLLLLLLGACCGTWWRFSRLVKGMNILWCMRLQGEFVKRFQILVEVSCVLIGQQ